MPSSATSCNLGKNFGRSCATADLRGVVLFNLELRVSLGAVEICNVSILNLVSKGSFPSTATMHYLATYIDVHLDFVRK